MQPQEPSRTATLASMPCPGPRLSRDRLKRLAICLGLFLWLVLWTLLWPYTGDGDSAIHYLNLRETIDHPAAGLSAWARPLYVLIMVGPAAGGLLAVRIYTAALTTLLAWQTMRLADDLKLQRAYLAGALLIWQPLFFALAADTMTEMPMALGIVITIRLWWAGRKHTALIVAGFLPLLRPEGLLLLPMWGVMALISRDFGHWLRRLRASLLLASGLAAWIAACWIVTGDPLWFVKYWSWPLKNYDSYGRGPLLHHVYLWPYYTGPVLIVLFLAGLRRTLRRGMALPWTIWLIVFVAHSLMWWLGIFGAIGLMRIQAVSAPITAVICLCGWNALAQRLEKWRLRRPWRHTLAVLTTLAATAVPMIYHWQTPDRHQCRPLLRTARWVQKQQVLNEAPRIFVGEQMMIIELDLMDSPRLMRHSWIRDDLLDGIKNLPPKSIVICDNQRSRHWYGITPQDIRPLGYETLYRAEHDPGNLWISSYFEDRPVPYAYVVLRKTPRDTTQSAAKGSPHPLPPPSQTPSP